jgi:1,4-dihydroxy-2-naphthoyl-CoA synthase
VLLLQIALAAAQAQQIPAVEKDKRQNTLSALNNIKRSATNALTNVSDLVVGVIVLTANSEAALSLCSEIPQKCMGHHVTTNNAATKLKALTF